METASLNERLEAAYKHLPGDYAKTAAKVSMLNIVEKGWWWEESIALSWHRWHDALLMDDAKQASQRLCYLVNIAMPLLARIADDATDDYSLTFDDAFQECLLGFVIVAKNPDLSAQKYSLLKALERGVRRWLVRRLNNRYDANDCIS